MKLGINLKNKRGCSYISSEKPSRLTRALETVGISSPNSCTDPDPNLSFNNTAREAVEAFKVQVEQARAMAIAFVQRNNIY